MVKILQIIVNSHPKTTTCRQFPSVGLVVTVLGVVKSLASVGMIDEMNYGRSIVPFHISNKNFVKLVEKQELRQTDRERRCVFVVML